MIYNHRELVKEEVVKFVKQYNPRTVLEIGAGVNSFNECFGKCTYWCIDKEESSISIKRDVHDLDKWDCYDCIFMCHTAEHFINPVKAWTNIYNALEVGGRVMSITPNHCEHQIINGDDDHIFVLTTFQWRRLLKYCGFRNIKSYIQMTAEGKQIRKEQDYNIITVAEK